MLFGGLNYYYHFFLMLLAFATGESKLDFEVFSRQILDKVPSASGMAFVNDIYIIGDNSPYLFQLNPNFQVTSKTFLQDDVLDENGVVPKSVKADFEAMAVIDSTLVVFGSGSLAPERDILVLVNVENPEEVQRYVITALYSRLRQHPMLATGELNIEGAVFKGDNLLLFNRDRNLIFIYSWDALLGFVRNGQAYPEPDIVEVKLPTLHGVQAGLSGATMLPGSEKIVFTASVEDRIGAVADGEILGSYIGILDLNSSMEPISVVISQGSDPLPIKVESVAVVRSSRYAADVLLVTDSDGGVSEILKGRIRWY